MISNIDRRSVPVHRELNQIPPQDAVDGIGGSIRQELKVPSHGITHRNDCLIIQRHQIGGLEWLWGFFQIPAISICRDAAAGIIKLAVEIRADAQIVLEDFGQIVHHQIPIGVRIGL